MKKPLKQVKQFKKNSDIVSFFKTTIKLRNILKNPKDEIKNEYLSGIVLINCENCDNKNILDEPEVTSKFVSMTISQTT